MSVYLDVESRLDRRALEATAREITNVFSKLGADVSKGLGGSMSKALGAFDTSSARAELAGLERAWTRAADVEAEAARRMEVSARRASEAVAKYGQDSSKAMAAQAAAARDQRGFTDALVANEAAHKSHTRAMEDSAATASMAGRAFNAAGLGSVAVFTGTVLEATKAAGNFQQSQQRLVSSAGETAAGLKTVSDGILNLAGQVGYSSEELSKGMYTVEKAGYRGADGVKVLTASAQLAKAENADLGEVLKGLTTSMHDFGYTQDQAALVASKMNVAVGEGKTNLQEFSSALASVEPIAAGAHISLDDVYGSLAQITQSGTSADRAAQNMAHSISQLIKPSSQMRDEMGALGIDSRNVSEHLGERGYAGTVQMLSNTIREHMNPAQQVVIDTMFKSQQATDSANTMFKALPGPAQAVATAIMNNSEAYKQFRKDRGGLSVLQANEIEQWYAIEKKVSGFSSTLKSGQGDVQQYEQALALMTGGQDSLRTVLQLVGDNQDATNDKIKKVKDTTAEADGTVKGFNETQQTLNSKMADAKAAFGAAAIELGNAFVPVMTDVANVAKDVGDAMAKHPEIVHDVIDAVGLMGGAWMIFKGYNIASAILTPIVGGLSNVIGRLGAVETQAVTAGGAMRGMGAAAAEGVAGVETAAAAEVAAEQRVAASALEADGAMAGGGAAGGASKMGAAAAAAGRFAGPAAMAYFAGKDLDQYQASHPGDPNNAITQQLQSAPGFTQFMGSHAGGGPLHAPGPKGVDSGLFHGADGEHVLTHHEVQKMGGHAGVYAFRQALMGGTVLRRAGGGPIGPDVSAAESMIGTPYSQAARNDCSGMVGRVVEAATGMGGALPSTRNMQEFLAARGFVSGTGGPGTLSVGWYNHGSGANDGHTAMTLSDGENAESGGSHGNFLVGGGAAGASSSQFDHHMYLPNMYGEGEGGSGGGAGGRGGGGGFGGGGGGGVPAGSTAGRGPGGQAGYYTPNPERVASAREELRHIDAEIATAEERKAHLKSDATQAQKDRLDEEIRHLKAERDQEQGRLQKAEQGTFHEQRGGGGRGSKAGMPVPLADKFGLDKGLPGVAEWAVGFLEDLVLGPLETGAMAAMNGGGFGGAPDGGAPGPMPGMPGDAPKVADVGGGGSGGSGGSGSGGSGPASWASGGKGGASSWWGGWHSGNSPAAPGAPGQPGAASNVNMPFPLPTDPSQWGSPPISGTPVPPILGLYGPALSGAPGKSGPLNPLEAIQKSQIQGGFAHGAPQTPMGIFDPSQNPLLQHHAKGGPAGTDTIPAWLSPGEEVEQKSAVDKYGAAFMEALNHGDVDPSDIQYHDGGMGTTNPPASPPPPPPAPPKVADPQSALPPPGPQSASPGPNAGTMKPSGPPQQQSLVKLPGSGNGAKALPGQAGQSGEPGSAPTGPTAAGSGTDVHDDLSNLPTPGAGDQRPGAGLPASQGIGFSGGIIGGAEGAVEGAASAAASMGSFGGAGGAASAAMQVGFQELNRAAAAGAQAAGVGVEGLLETVIPDSSGTGGDWMKTIPGRLLSGVAGARPAGQNTAGQTTPSVAGGGQSAQYSGMGQQGPANGGVSIQNLHVQADNHDQMVDSINSAANISGNMYPTAGNVSGPGGGR